MQSLDDRHLKRAFEAQLSELHERGDSVPAAELHAQLVARQQHLELTLADPDIRLTPAQIYRERIDSTLMLGRLHRCSKCSKNHVSASGAVVLTQDGVAVTSLHVLSDDAEAADAAAGTLTYAAMTRDERILPVLSVLAASPYLEDDLAIVQLGGEGLTAAPVSRLDEVGGSVSVISHPGGRFYSLTQGVISRSYVEHRSRGNDRMRLAITAEYAGGSSGCGVFNESGALAGIVATTNTIHHHDERKGQRNAQMVARGCIPASAIWRLAGQPLAGPSDGL